LEVAQLVTSPSITQKLRGNVRDIRQKISSIIRNHNSSVAGEPDRPN
jgi:hypothetical protein